MPRRSWPQPRSPEGRSASPHWPSYTHQPGDAIRDVLSAFGADVDFDEHGLTVRGTNKITGVDLDLRGPVN